MSYKEILGACKEADECFVAGGQKEDCGAVIEEKIWCSLHGDISPFPDQRGKLQDDLCYHSRRKAQFPTKRYCDKDPFCYISWWSVDPSEIGKKVKPKQEKAALVVNGQYLTTGAQEPYKKDVDFSSGLLSSQGVNGLTESSQKQNICM